ncbi:MAG: membrane protein insertion efficiency factor YidD [Verrucomicrobiales bacterium]
MRSLVSWFIFLGIRMYQRFLSPVLHALAGPLGGCRFDPTCSHYFLQAVQQHGPWKGSWIGLRRILRCHPWGGHGYDPVPPPKGEKARQVDR